MIKVKINKILSIAFLFLIIVFSACREEELFDQSTVSTGNITTLSFSGNPMDLLKVTTRASDIKDENEKKTMNTHLHILEPYTNLYRVWKDEHLKKQLRNLILIFTDKILDHRTYHLNLFFNEDWESKYRIISYGHDIEASWLLHEAAIELGDNEILQKVEPLVQKVAIAAEDGLLANGSLIYEYHPNEKKADTDLHWWVQAENVVGHFNLYQHFGDEPALGTAYTCWKFIQRYLIDKEQGEWHWSVSLDHEINREDDKAGFWKCPYHNGRMCMEIIERLAGE